LRAILWTICREPNDLQLLAFEGRGLKACLVEYGNVSSKDDVVKKDEEGFIMREIDVQAEKGYVLARFIPVSQDKNNRSYFAVFEKSQATLEAENRLRAAVYSHFEEEGNSVQADSKSALSR